MNTANWICPNQPFGHDWNAGLECRRCGATRTAGEAIVSGLASVRGWSDEAARTVRDAFAAELLHGAAESAAEIQERLDRATSELAAIKRQLAGLTVRQAAGQR
jgi:hypothetical protein